MTMGTHICNLSAGELDTGRPQGQLDNQPSLYGEVYMVSY